MKERILMLGKTLLKAGNTCGGFFTRKKSLILAVGRIV